MLWWAFDATYHWPTRTPHPGPTRPMILLAWPQQVSWMGVKAADNTGIQNGLPIEVHGRRGAFGMVAQYPGE